MSSRFVELLQRAADVLAVFAESSSPGALRWDGEAYRPTERSFQADEYAAKWWSTLTTLSGMLNAQEASLSPGQKRYLDRLLFGGMGSFNDVCLDQKRLGPEAARANQELERLRREMFEEFAKM
jgi:hypothetical protein